jgi:O-antigen/teichoic acid export membrane protein
LLVAVLVGEAGAGLYGATGRLILAGQLMMIATAQSMAPLLSAAFTAGRLDEAQRVLRTITGWNVTLLWPAFIGLAFAAPTVLSFFGPEFSEAWPLVVVLSVAMMVILALGAGDTLLTMTGDSRGSLINHVAALAVMVGVAVVLLPTVGIIGAAWAWAASRLTLRGLAVLRVARSHGIHAGGRQVLIGGLVCLVVYVPTGVGALVVLGPGVPAIAAHAVSGAAVHLVLLVRLRSLLELDLLLPVLLRRNR